MSDDLAALVRRVIEQASDAPGLSKRERIALKMILRQDDPDPASADLARKVVGREVQREMGRAGLRFGSAPRRTKTEADARNADFAARLRMGLPTGSATPRPRSKSESDRLRAERWTRDKMIRALKVHGYPGRREYQRLHKADPSIPSDYTVWREFGSWAKALEEARRSRLTV